MSGRRNKRNFSRKEAFRTLRNTDGGGLEKITLHNGAEIFVNPLKHFLLKKPYKNPELTDHLYRKIGRYALGEKKMAELEKMAAGVKEKTSADVIVETNQ